MAQESGTRDFELLVFGATGFTARYVVEYLLTSGSVPRWAVCARSSDKMHKVLSELYTKHPDSSCKPHMVFVDINDGQVALQAVTKRAVVVINCAGPYLLLGPPVVEACVETHTHMVDFTGEAVYIQRAMLDHHRDAFRNRTLIVPGCGMTHTCADVLSLNAMIAKLSADAAANGVTEPKFVIDAFFQWIPGKHGYRLNTGTFDSSIGGMLSMGEMVKLDKKLPPPRTTCKEPMKHDFGPPIYNEERLKGTPVVARLDAEIMHINRRLRLTDAGVTGTEGLIGADQVSLRYSLVVNCWLNVLKAAISMIICTILSFIPGVRQFLVRNAHFFTWGVFHPQGPTEEQVTSTKSELTVFGTWRNEDGSKTGSHVKHYYLDEPAYAATSKIIVASALTILHERDVLPQGGVLTCGIVFAKSSIIQRFLEIGAIRVDAD